MGIRMASCIIALLVCSGFVAAETRTQDLPVENVYDPEMGTNEPITDYSFERLDYLFWNSPSFVRWNDGKRVCASMRILFGRESGRCANLPTEAYARRVETRHRTSVTQARVTFTVLPPSVMLVSPPYPPWRARKD